MDVIISPDTRRTERLPPGQTLIHKFPASHVGEIPAFDPKSWDLTLFPAPLVKTPTRFTWNEFRELPQVKVVADMHCVSGWSRLDNFWEGVSTHTLLENATLGSAAKFVMVHCEYGWCANMSLEDFLAEDAILAMKHNGDDLTQEQGYPVRLVVPRLYAWKSGKWVRGIELMTEDRAGFYESWENGGYHMRGNPWSEERRRIRED